MATDPYKAWDAKQANKKYWQTHPSPAKSQRTTGRTLDPGQRAARTKRDKGMGEYKAGRGFFEMIPRSNRPKKMPKRGRSAGNIGEKRPVIPPAKMPTGKTPYEIRSGNKLSRNRF